MMAVFFCGSPGSWSPAAIVAILQQATVKPPNIIAHEKGFKSHAQPQTGAYSCSNSCFNSYSLPRTVPRYHVYSSCCDSAPGDHAANLLNLTPLPLPPHLHHTSFQVQFY